MNKKRVLILCTGNLARSRMAEGLLRHDAGERFAVESARTQAGTVRRKRSPPCKSSASTIARSRSMNLTGNDSTT